MDNPSKPRGRRYIISQPREPWEQCDSPLVNESPQAIVDRNDQLHIVYSANGNWRDRYCLSDLWLRKGGDLTNVWDWYKSNGCLFGSCKERLIDGSTLTDLDIIPLPFQTATLDRVSMARITYRSYFMLLTRARSVRLATS